MSSVFSYKPNMIQFNYHQDNSDKDYGSCLWADFIFDLDKWRLIIDSDCGKYICDWLSEWIRLKKNGKEEDENAFLKFICSLNDDYLIEKIARKDYINSQKTFENFKNALENKDIDDYCLALLKEACFSSSYDSICFNIRELALNYRESFEELLYIDYCYFIEMDYSRSVKTIIKIFRQYIIPEIKDYIRE